MSNHLPLRLAATLSIIRLFLGLMMWSWCQSRRKPFLPANQWADPNFLSFSNMKKKKCSTAWMDSFFPPPFSLRTNPAVMPASSPSSSRFIIRNKMTSRSKCLEGDKHRVQDVSSSSSSSSSHPHPSRVPLRSEVNESMDKDLRQETVIVCWYEFEL